MAHLGPVGPRWAACWPHEPCYQGCLISISIGNSIKLVVYLKTTSLNCQSVGSDFKALGSMLQLNDSQCFQLMMTGVYGLLVGCLNIQHRMFNCWVSCAFKKAVADSLSSLIIFLSAHIHSSCKQINGVFPCKFKILQLLCIAMFGNVKLVSNKVVDTIYIQILPHFASFRWATVRVGLSSVINETSIRKEW